MLTAQEGGGKKTFMHVAKANQMVRLDSREEPLSFLDPFKRKLLHPGCCVLFSSIFLHDVTLIHFERIRKYLLLILIFSLISFLCV